MDKNKRNTLIVIGIILLVICIACIVYINKFSKKEDINITYTNELENKVKNVVENKTENIVVENVVENETNEVKNETSSTELVPSSSVYETNTDLGSTNRKQEAIGLVQKEWGKDDSVSFRCDSVTPDGKYIIAVVSKKTATVQNYFEVDLEKKTVEVDY